MRKNTPDMVPKTAKSYREQAQNEQKWPEVSQKESRHAHE